MILYDQARSDWARARLVIYRTCFRSCCTPCRYSLALLLTASLGGIEEFWFSYGQDML